LVKRKGADPADRKFRKLRGIATVKMTTDQIIYSEIFIGFNKIEELEVSVSLYRPFITLDQRMIEAAGSLGIKIVFTKSPESPFDVAGVQTKAATKDVLEADRESRAGDAELFRTESANRTKPFEDPDK
jgi:hypothetical protein